MDYVKQLSDIGWGTVFTVVMLLILALPSIGNIINNFVSFFGIETKWSLKRKAELETMEEIKHEISEMKQNRVNDRAKSLEIQEQLTNTQTELQKTLTELKTMFIRKEIDDMRWELLNFANAVISGRDYNKEQYDHVLDVYTEYEEILEENHMTNGRVTESMEFVKKKYAELLEKGFGH